MNETPPAARSHAGLRRVIRAMLIGLGAASTLGLALPAAAAPGSKKDGASKGAKHATAKGKGKGDAKKGSKSPVARASVAGSPPEPAAPKGQPLAVALQIDRVTLENGLRVVLN